MSVYSLYVFSLLLHVMIRFGDVGGFMRRLQTPVGLASDRWHRRHLEVGLRGTLSIGAGISE